MSVVSYMFQNYQQSSKYFLLEQNFKGIRMLIWLLWSVIVKLGLFSCLPKQKGGISDRNAKVEPCFIQLRAVPAKSRAQMPYECNAIATRPLPMP